MILNKFSRTKLSMGIFLSLIALVFFSQAVLAGLDHSAKGWVWSGSESVSDSIMNGNETGIGWISMNSLDCDADENGTIDNSSCGVVGSPIANYGVNIPPTSGLVTGYGWSERLGWISFNSTDLTGCSPVLEPAQRVGNKIIGGARILSIQEAGSYANGFDGCISLSGIVSSDGSEYGISISSDSLLGFAWSSDFGWLDFSGVKIPLPLPNLVPQLGSFILSEPDFSNGKYTKAKLAYNISNPNDGLAGAFISSFEFDLDNNGTYEQSETISTTGLPANSAGDTKEIVLNKSINPGVYKVRFTVDKTTTVNPNGQVIESDELDNIVIRSYSASYFDPGIELIAEPTLVRAGTNTTLKWNTKVTYAMNCSILGPNMNYGPFDPSVSGALGSIASAPIKNKSEFLLTCIAPDGTTFTDNTFVETTGTIQEI